MVLYETTFFSRQKTRSAALTALRPAINARLSELRAAPALPGYVAIASAAIKAKIRAACGSPRTTSTHIWELPISGHWRIFIGQGLGGSVVILMVGHLNGNVVEQP